MTVTCEAPTNTALNNLVAWLKTCKDNLDRHVFEGTGKDKDECLVDGIAQAKAFADKMRKNIGEHEGIVKITVSYNRVTIELVKQKV